MGDYPKAARAATIKCISCNSPVVLTVDEEYVCLDCGESPIESVGSDERVESAHAPTP